MTADPQSGRKLRSSIDKLALEYSDTNSGLVAALVDTFLTDEDSAAIVQNIIGDIVFRFLLASAKKIRSECTASNFDDELDRFIVRKTRLSGAMAINLRKYLKLAVLASEEERPKSERKDRIKKKQKLKNCYLCSKAIDDELVLDHVWPRSAGGGNGKSNLRIAHASCEAVKADIALSGDVAVGRFAFVSLPRTLGDDRQESWWPINVASDDDFRSLLDDIRGTQMKIALLGRQAFRCFRCEKPFQDSESCTVAKRNHDEPWWFPNVVALCDNCIQEENR